MQMHKIVQSFNVNVVVGVDIIAYNVCNTTLYVYPDLQIQEVLLCHLKTVLANIGYSGILVLVMGLLISFYILSVPFIELHLCLQEVRFDADASHDKIITRLEKYCDCLVIHFAPIFC